MAILFTPSESTVLVTMTGEGPMRRDPYSRHVSAETVSLRDELPLSAARRLLEQLTRAVAAAEEHDQGAARRAAEAEFERLRKELGK